MQFQWKKSRGRCYLLFGVLLAVLILYKYSRTVRFHPLPLQGSSRELDIHARTAARFRNLSVQRPEASDLLDQSYEGSTSKIRRDEMPETENWQSVQMSRVEKVRSVCSKDDMIYLRSFRTFGTNRKRGKHQYCDTKRCPVIVDENNALFYCFIPQVASTALKTFFLKLSDIAVNSSLQSDIHHAADSVLHRVSPSYFSQSTLRKFYKFLFVRHPFDRLVSAFKEMGERSREEVPEYYKFWDPLMKSRRGEENVTETSRPTFSEFVWHLLHTYVGNYDEHWYPYWTRCQPCQVDYDFIGKLETASHDFPYVFQQIGGGDSADFIKGIDKSRETTKKYFGEISSSEITRLYSIYHLDFETFGYTLEGFLPSTTNITS